MGLGAKLAHKKDQEMQMLKSYGKRGIKKLQTVGLEFEK